MMKNKSKISALSVIANQHKLGTLSYDNDKLSFRYDESWQDWKEAFALSVSMPISEGGYGHDVVEPYLWGLLPDNYDILEQYGKQFHVSPRNVFRLLEHLGEDCPGAIQFITEEDEAKLLSGAYREEVDWIDVAELNQLIASIKKNQGLQRASISQGQFSLAGAQPKTALYQCKDKGRWGVPKGMTPTTHILKPAVGEFNGIAENEHYCLKLAEAIGLKTVRSSVIKCEDIPVIVVERYDRIYANDALVRIHQEDMCQAHSVDPRNKYENQGGPSVSDMADTLWDFSNEALEDIRRLADALIYNYLIIGTDAHAKNYSMLHLTTHHIRMTPLYDVASILPYPNQHESHKIKLAMKTGSEYLIRKIEKRHWETCAKQLKLKPVYLLNRLNQLAQDIIDNADSVAANLHHDGLDDPIINKLASLIKQRAEDVLAQYAGSH